MKLIVYVTLKLHYNSIKEVIEMDNVIFKKITSKESNF